jgi:hypothetical protein
MTPRETTDELITSYTEGDKKLLKDAKTPMDKMQFINMVISRVGMEMQASEPTSGSPMTEDKEAELNKWINDEIHYEIERRMHSEGASQINGEQLYVEVRIAVLRAVVARSVELFTAWNGKISPSDESDKENLRADLRPYFVR